MLCDEEHIYGTMSQMKFIHTTYCYEWNYVQGKEGYSFTVRRQCCGKEFTDTSIGAFINKLSSFIPLRHYIAIITKF